MNTDKTPRQTFPKSCRLRHRSLVESLFSSGSGVFDFPLRIVWRVLSQQELEASFRNGVPDRIGPLQMLITVPKKKRRHAVDRVLMRRRIREAFRLGRDELAAKVASAPDARTLSMAIIYQSGENLPYSKIEKSMARLLGKIGRRAFPEPEVESVEEGGVE